MKRLVGVLIAILMTVIAAFPASAECVRPLANENVADAYVSFKKDGTASFSVTTSRASEIKVTSVILQYKDGAGTWRQSEMLNAPTAVCHDANTFSTSKNYSGSCAEGMTYRIVATFSVNGVSITRYSGGVKF